MNVDVFNSLVLMGKGMAAIFFVIIIIYVVVAILLKTTKEK
jgi:hypothetical protein